MTLNDPATLPDPAAPPQESAAWKNFRKVRWCAALLIVAGALVVFAAWLETGTHLACQVTTVTHTGGQTQITRVCGLPDISDYLYVLAVVGVLLVPDAKSLKIGGLQFERLSNKVEAQTRELNRLSQTVTQTFNIGTTQAAVTEEIRAAVRGQKKSLDDLRSYLARDDHTDTLLTHIDGLAQQIETASLLELLSVAMIVQPLIEQARAAIVSSAKVPASTDDQLAEEALSGFPAPAAQPLVD